MFVLSNQKQNTFQRAITHEKKRKRKNRMNEKNKLTFNCPNSPSTSASLPSTLSPNGPYFPSSRSIKPSNHSTLTSSRPFASPLFSPFVLRIASASWISLDRMSSLACRERAAVPSSARRSARSESASRRPCRVCTAGVWVSEGPEGRRGIEDERNSFLFYPSSIELVQLMGGTKTGRERSNLITTKNLNLVFPFLPFLPHNPFFFSNQTRGDRMNQSERGVKMKWEK